MNFNFDINQHYENLAIHYRGAATLLKCKASIHVEDFEDAVFWERIFHHFLPENKYNFIYYSQSPKGYKTTGCEQCLKYKSFLDKQFFICIDSDYRYILQEQEICISNFILQTYTYSIENHLCFAMKLNRISEKCTGIKNFIFDFEVFLANLSNTVYELFIWHLHFLKQNNESTFSRKDFINTININNTTNFNIQDNAKAYLNNIKSKCNAKIAELTSIHGTVDLEKDRNHLAALGLHPNKTYLYVRGHNLFDLIVKIGNTIINQVLILEKMKIDNPQKAKELFAQITPFKRELERVIEFNGYDEITKIKEDIFAINAK